MSSSLVRRSLSLFDDDLHLKQDQSSLKKKKKKTNLMAAVGTQKKGLKKKLLKLKEQQQTKKNTKKYRKSALEEFLDKKAEDYTEESVQTLQRISQLNATESKTSKLIFEHHLKSKRVRSVDTEDKRGTEQSVFSEEDFKNFSKEFDLGKK